MTTLSDWVSNTTYVPTLLWILILLLSYFVVRDLIRWFRRRKFLKKSEMDMIDSERKMDELYDKLEKNRVELMKNLVDLDEKLSDTQKKDNGDNTNA